MSDKKLSKEKKQVVELLVKKLVRKEIKLIANGFKNQLTTLQGNNRTLLRNQENIESKQHSFIKAIPKAFEYMHEKYGQNGNISPETYSKMAMNVVKFNMLELGN